MPEASVSQCADRGSFPAPSPVNLGALRLGSHSRSFLVRIPDPWVGSRHVIPGALVLLVAAALGLGLRVSPSLSRLVGGCQSSVAVARGWSRSSDPARGRACPAPSSPLPGRPQGPLTLHHLLRLLLPRAALRRHIGCSSPFRNLSPQAMDQSERQTQSASQWKQA